MKTLVSLLLFAVVSIAMPAMAYEMTYNGRIYKPDGTSADLFNFYLRFDFKTVNQIGGSDCYLYEQQTASPITSDEDGIFQVLLTAGSRSFGPADLGNVFLYSAARACYNSSGAPTGSSLAISQKESLELVVYFKEDVADAWDEIDRQTIRPTPEAINAEYFAGNSPSAFIKANGSANQTNFNNFFQGTYFSGVQGFVDTGNMVMTSGVTTVANPATDMEAANKIYVDTTIANAVALSAGSLSSSIGNYLPLSGGTMAGSVHYSGHDATGVGYLTQTSDRFFQVSNRTVDPTGIDSYYGALWFDVPNNVMKVQGTSGIKSLIDSADSRLAPVGTAGTYTKVTTDAYGRITVGSSPTTLAGYGILDAGTVTNVGLSAPAIFTVSGSPVTASGTMGLALNSQAQRTVFAAPTSAAGQPVFRELDITDIRSRNSPGQAFFNVGGVCPDGYNLQWSSVTDQLECDAYSLTLLQVTTALGVIHVANGSVGIATATPAANLDVAGSLKVSGITTMSGALSALNLTTGNITASGSIGVAGDVISGATVQGVSLVTTSDARLKENVRDLAGLDLILGLHPVQFRWKKTGMEDIGFLAQEVEEVDSRLVITNPETGIKGVKYVNIVAPLVQSTQELHEKITGLESQVRTLSSENHQLREEIREIRELIQNNIQKSPTK